ncbi:MAG: hypothetical protein AABX04_01530 [Nanoarchaeota archaeon]
MTYRERQERSGIVYLVGRGVFQEGKVPPESVLETREVKLLLPGELPYGYDLREIDRQRIHFSTSTYSG